MRRSQGGPRRSTSECGLCDPISIDSSRWYTGDRVIVLDDEQGRPIVVLRFDGPDDHRAPTKLEESYMFGIVRGLFGPDAYFDDDHSNEHYYRRINV